MATAAAAVLAKARRDVICHFMERNAVGETSAVPFNSDRAIERRMLERFLRRGVIVRTGPDTYFLDVPAYARWKRVARRRAMGVMAGVALVGAALAAIGVGAL